jgi:hypothetical protein
MANDHKLTWGQKQPPRPAVDFDETAGEQSRELGGSYIREGEQGSNQFLRGNDPAGLYGKSEGESYNAYLQYAIVGTFASGPQFRCTSEHAA